MNVSSSRPRAIRWRPLATLLACALGLSLARPLESLTRHSITVDGNTSDWADILIDPENVVADAGSFSDPPDPDNPGTSDRDLRGAAFTWDSSNLYLWFRRTLTGTNSFDFLAYLDLGHDKTLGSSDVIVRLSYAGGTYQGGSIRHYLPSNAAQGDAITGDGVDEPGQMGSALPGVPSGANSPDGIEFEASVPWTALGVPSGSCLWIHPSIARGTNLPSQVEDNTDPLDTQDVSVGLSQDHVGAVATPGQVDYAHQACNRGSCGDTFDLSVRSPHGWQEQLWSDPNGDGNPADGQLMGVDANGDGDFSDARDGDSLNAAFDTNANGLPDTGALAANACFNYVVRMVIPSGVATGTVDDESVRARSATRVRDLARNTDETNVGPVVVFSDQNRTGFPGDQAWLPERACNEQSFADTITLSATSSQGWTLQIYSDPNGDGNPSDGAPISSTGVLAPGTCFSFVVRDLIPAGAAAGTVDAVTVQGTSQASASVFDTASDQVTVAAARFTVTPDNTRDAGPGNYLFFAHVLTNNQSASDSFALTATSAQAGYTVTLLTDPDGNGLPNDSTTIPQGSVVGPVAGSGGLYHFIVRVDVPFGVAIPSTDTITVTAKSQLDTSRTATATDTINIRRILTYSDPLFARPSKTFYVSCAHVYVQAHGLTTNKQYRFLWSDPSGVLQRTSPSYSPDVHGRADDSYSIPCGQAAGTWTVKVQEKNGSLWTDVPNGSTTFTTLAPGQGGHVTLLQTDNTIYNKVGDNVSVESTQSDSTAADYVNTFADYTIFMDQNGDGVPTAGEPFIQSDGTRASWAVGNYTHETTPINILSNEVNEDYFRINNVQFQTEGTWCVYERWAQHCTSGTCSDVTIDTKLTCFQVSCLPVPQVNAGADKASCAGAGVPLSDSSSNGDTFSWDDAAAGGTFSPSATVLHPTYTPPSVGGFTLTLTATFGSTGCHSTDSLQLTVNANPTVDAGADKRTCAASGVALSDSSSSADTFSWSDGGAGGAFSPSRTVLHPTYTPPDPSPAAVTLTLTATISATGCQRVDTLTLTVDPRPSVDAGTDKTTCAGDGIGLSDSSSTATSNTWSDGGAGGAFTPSATTLHPTYTPPDPSPASLTLTLTGQNTATGCSRVDTLTLTVNPNPAVNAGADKRTCGGVGVTLGDSSSTADTNTWSDGGAGGVFSPSATVLHPTYTPALAFSGTITLTLTGRMTATACDTVDTLALAVDATPTVNAGADKRTCAGVGVALSDATTTAASVTWSDGGEGGTFSPSASVLNPTYTPPSPSGTPIQLSLTGTNPSTGCTAADSLVLTVDPLPVVDAGVDKHGCPGVAIPLSDATSTGADTFAWTDGGGGGTFSPSASILQPSYLPPNGSARTLTLTVTESSTGCTQTDTVVVASDLVPPTAHAGPDRVIDCRSASVTLQGSATGGDGSAGYTFDWEPAAQVSDPSAAQPSTSVAGTYTLTVTDVATGCISTDTALVTVNTAPPTADAGADVTLTCRNPITTLAGAASGGDGSAGYDFHWEPAGQVSDPSVAHPTTSTAGTYTLTVTSRANGCTASDTMVVTADEAVPVADAGPDQVIDCSQPQVTLNGSASGGNGSLGYAYHWEPAGAVTSPDSAVTTASASGTYTLTVTDAANGCTGTDTVVVTTSVAPPVANAGPDGLVTCARPVATLQGSASGGDGSAGYTYQWSPATGVANPNAAVTTTTQPGTYTLLVVDVATGCRAADTAVIVDGRDPPVASAGPDPRVDCRTPSVALQGAASGGDGSSGYAFAWTPAAGLSDPTSATPVTSTPGTYTLTVTDRANGCQASDSVVVTASLTPPVADAGPDLVRTCSSPQVVLQGAASGGDGSAGYTFAWTPAAGLSDPTSATPTTSADGTYLLTVTDSANGCQGTDTVVVTSHQQPPVANAGPDQILTCANPVVPLTGGASGGDGSLGYTYHWDPVTGVGDPTTSSTIATAAGTYTLTVTDVATGCTATDTVVVSPNPPAPTASAGPDQQLTCSSASVTLVGAASGGSGASGYTYQWTPAAGLGSPNAATTTATLPGVYVLTVTDVATACQGADAVVVRGTAPPVANAGADQQVTCVDLHATLTGSASGGDGSAGYSYSWSPAAAVSDASSAATVANGPGTYTLTVTDNANGCTSVDTVDVVQLPAPPWPEPSDVDLAPAATPLRVRWQDPAARSQVLVTWGDVGAYRYRLYAGDLARLVPAWRGAGYDHGQAACDLTTPQATLAPPQGGVYFLAVSANCDGVESSYGRDSYRRERPNAATASGNPCP